MKRLAVLTILLFITLFITDVYAPESKTFKVYVDVSAYEEDKTERETIESHLKRELRALGDVIIVGEEDEWEWRLLVNVLGHTFKDGSKGPWTSIAISTQRRVPKFHFNNYDFISTPVYSVGLTPAHWPKDDLHGWCISTANRFDKVLQVFR